MSPSTPETPVRKLPRIARTLAWLATAAVLPFFSLTAYLGFRHVEDQVDHATGDIARSAGLAASEAREVLRDARYVLAAVAKRTKVAALDAGDCDPLLADMLQLHPEYAAVFTLDAQGAVICSGGASREAIPARVEPADFLEAAKGPRAATSAPLKGPITGKWVVVIAEPILRNQELAGVAVVSLDLEWLSRLLAQSPSPPTGVTAIVDRRGTTVARFPEAGRWIGQAEPRGGSYLWSRAQVPDSDWIAISGVDRDAVLAKPRRIAWTVTALAFFITLAVALLSTVIARRIARPLEAIASAAHRMGEPGAPPAHPEGTAETAALAGELNRMHERHLAHERDLEEQRRDLVMMADHFPGLVARYDRELRYRFASAGYRVLFGHDPEALIGQRIEDVIPAGHFARLRPHLERALAGETVDFEMEAVPVGQRDPVMLAITVTPDRDAADAVRGLFLFATDVSHRRNAESRLRHERARLYGLVSSAMDAVVTVDSRRLITLFNPAAEAMFGYSADEVIGGTLDRLIPARSRDRHDQFVVGFARTGVTSRAMGALGVVMGLRRDGEEFPLEAAISQVEAGGERYFTAILRDVTQRERTERELRLLTGSLERRVAERTAELEAANRELEAFDYSISHDLRGPLGRIQGFSGILLEDEPDLNARTRDYLGRIVATASSMDRLVEDLLALSLVGRGELARATVDVSAMAAALVDALRRETPERTVDVIIAPGMSAHADAGLLRALLENLIGNAWKFTARRADARIELGWEPKGDTMAFFVRDNGAGFDPARAERLFEPFRRLHSQAEFKGTGIGLATVARIVRRHGGSAWAEGQVDQGATFHFTLSALPAAAS